MTSKLILDITGIKCQHSFSAEGIPYSTEFLKPELAIISELYFSRRDMPAASSQFSNILIFCTEIFNCLYIHSASNMFSIYFSFPKTIGKL